MWFANSERRTAFKVQRYIKSRDVYVLVNAFGTEFEESTAELAAWGYRQVDSRPRYALYRNANGEIREGARA